MSAKYSFNLQSGDRKRDLPGKIIIGQNSTETRAHVVLKLIAYLLFYRERLQIGVNLHMDSIPYVPDLVQLDYELRPALWIECGECGAGKLHKLAVKVPEAEIWVVKQSRAEVELLMHSMEKMDLRRNRYGLVGLDGEMFDEICGMVRSRNVVFWVDGSIESSRMQFDFNGLWFDASFDVLRF